MSKYKISRPTNNDLTYTLLYPVHLGIKTITTINKCDFIIIVVQDNFGSRYICQLEALQNSLSVIGYDDSEIRKTLLSDIYFRLYSFRIGDLNLIVSGIGKSNNADWNYTKK
ncbi:44051_t:CDS:2, partial [Gigaspora margarita]